MTQRKRALITGITGQDGSYLSELLLEKGYEVHGIIRRSSSFNTDRIDHIYVDPHSEGARLFLHYGDLTDGTTLRRILEEVQPVEIYNLGAQSHVRVSFDSPEYTVDAVGMGVLRLLEAIRDYQRRTGIEVRFYQAGSSEMFGLVQEVPQKETTPFYPRSPYACAKVYGSLANSKLSRILRTFCLQRHLVQSRISPPRRNFCNSQNYSRYCPNTRRQAEKDFLGQSRFQAGLGLC